MLRNFLLILLISLLPIRSWAYETMGLKMALQTYSAEMMANGDMSHCEMMQSSPDTLNVQSENQDNQQGNTCTLCMAFGFAISNQQLSIYQLSFPILQLKPLPINSALLGLPFKPPIL